MTHRATGVKLGGFSAPTQDVYSGARPYRGFVRAFQVAAPRQPISRYARQIRVSPPALSKLSSHTHTVILIAYRVNAEDMNAAMAVISNEIASIRDKTTKGRNVMSANQSFEIPKQLRELAEKNVEQARATYTQFMDAMMQSMNVWSAAPSNVMTSGFRQVQELAIRFAKENAEAGLALAAELAAAKDIQSVMTLQSRYAQNQLQSYARQTQELGQLMAAAMGSMRSKS